ncbi:hypothetical protein [Sediminitomix flava]|uniref:Uncharacterized protein n=1 Tax=Sediminitomix flava TaxID=379075 RepID=A0A315ZT41_SEDFL|nr:hypothetical protein [Sediminitomix flava]PWJ38000.1 hypothetical protein BC781_108135 [Sediminitomix flava]
MEKVVEKSFLKPEALKEGFVSSLNGTKWLVSGNFVPFNITFEANGVCSVESVNGYFSATGTWSGNESSVIFVFTYESTGESYHCHATPDQGKGTIHLLFKGQSYLIPLSMKED